MDQANEPEGPAPRPRRRIRLIQPRLQLKLIGSFAGLVVLGLLLQYLLLASRLSEIAAAMPEGGSWLQANLAGLLLGMLGLSVVLVLPLVFAVGVLATFRIAGPLYRFERYLEGVARGEQLGPCRIRKGDELQDLCELINQATEPLRRRQVREGEGEGADRSEALRTEVRKAG